MAEDQPDATELLLPCVVCGEESDAMMCDKYWDEYQRIAGIVDDE